MSNPALNDMFEKSVIHNQLQTLELHKNKWLEREALEQRFNSIHAGNMRKDAPFASMDQQNIELEVKANREMEKINAAY